MKDFNPSDISHPTIKKLFEQQMKKITMKSCGIAESFDYQFSDRWI